MYWVTTKLSLELLEDSNLEKKESSHKSQRSELANGRRKKIGWCTWVTMLSRGGSGPGKTETLGVPSSFHVHISCEVNEEMYGEWNVWINRWVKKVKHT